MAKAPTKKLKDDWYWPLGAIDYALEIWEEFPDEAQLLGVITILWNRQEIALRNLYRALIASPRTAYAEAIWDRQPTHQARRDLLSIALHTVKLTKRQTGILTAVIENTKTLADRRNELIHAEYVVHGRTDTLHARVKAPRSNKPPKHQKAAPKDLERVAAELSHLVASTEFAIVDFMPRSWKLRQKKFTDIFDLIRSGEPLPQNPQSGSAPRSGRRKPHAKP